MAPPSETDKNNDNDDKPLTAQELIYIRKIIEKDKQWKWLTTMMRNTAGWLAAIIVGVTVSGEALSKFLKALIK